jgi:hypothetical protein
MSDSRHNARARAARLLAVSLTLALAPCAAVHAADACEASFQSSGDEATGLVFDARIKIPQLRVSDALLKMRDIATADGFEVGKDVIGNGKGMLVLVQKPGKKTRPFGIEVNANDQGTVSMTAHMPPGMQATSENIRPAMCGMLARLQSSGGETGGGTSLGSLATRSDTSAPAAAGGTMPAPVTPEESSRICTANVEGLTGEVDDTRPVFATWTLGPGGDDARAALERVKKGAGGMSDLRVGNDSYAGKIGRLNVDVISTSSYVDSSSSSKDGETPPFPVHIEYDAGMAAISLAAQPRAGRKMNAGRIGYLMCTLAAMANQAAKPEKPRGYLSRALIPSFNRDRREAEGKTSLQSQSHEALYKRAIYAGKAFVITPAVDLKDKYGSMTQSQKREKALIDYWVDATAVTVWQDRAHPDNQLTTGYAANEFAEGFRGWTAALPWHNSLYTVYFVDPGTYDLKKASLELRRASLPSTAESHATTSPKIGTVTLAATLDTEYYRTQEWKSADYRTTMVDQPYCVTQPNGSGCAYVAHEQVANTEMVSPAHYEDVSHKRAAGGLAVSATLTRPFASFTVTPGDVALIDGFWADADSAAIDTNACKKDDSDTITCAITRFSLWRVPAMANAAAIGRQATADVAPVKSGIFADAHPVPVQVTAKPTDANPSVIEAPGAKRYVIDAK